MLSRTTPYLLHGPAAPDADFHHRNISLLCHAWHPGQHLSGVSVSLLPWTRMAQHSYWNSSLSAWCCSLKNICRDMRKVHLPDTKQAGHHKESYHQFHQLFLSKQMIIAWILLFQEASVIVFVFFSTWGLCPNGCFVDNSSGIWIRDWSLYWPVG